MIKSAQLIRSESLPIYVLYITEIGSITKCVMIEELLYNSSNDIRTCINIQSLEYREKIL